MANYGSIYAFSDTYLGTDSGALFNSSTTIHWTRKIGTFLVDVIIEESANHSIELTSHPVQQGAAITDHKYQKPITLSMTVIQGGTSANDLGQKYVALVKLQNSNEMLKVITPKVSYLNMQIKSISVTTDKNTENVLSIKIEMQKVHIVNVTTTGVPARSKQRTPAKTGATENAGTKQATKETAPKRVSALSTLFGGRR